MDCKLSLILRTILLFPQVYWVYCSMVYMSMVILLIKVERCSCGWPGEAHQNKLGPVNWINQLQNLKTKFLLSHGISAMMTSCTLYMRTLYSDNTQLYTTIHKQQRDGGTVDLEACFKDINSWCVSNKLVLNDRKTELIDLHIHSKFS